MKNRLALFIIGAFLLLLGGCASIPMAPVDQDIKAKNFAPSPNRASLYIFRNESFGGGSPFLVMVNGKALGQTAAQTYFFLSLRPGKYNIESHAENASSLSILIEPNKNYFVWQQVKLGLFHPRGSLEIVDENVGRSGVMESKLVFSGISGEDISPLDAPVSPQSVQQPSSTKSSAPSGDPLVQKLRELQKLKNDGIITEDEYQNKKRQLLERL